MKTISSISNISSISSRNNSFISEIVKLKQKKYRVEKNLFYVEGIKLLKDAVNSDYRHKIKNIIAEENILRNNPEIVNIINIIKDFDGVTVTAVTKEIYKKITDEEAFQGIMCVIEKMPDNIEINYNKPVIILNSVRDPGNVGTIIRTANAICDFDIILSYDCADIYNSKTQRAAMGSVFRQNIKICKNIYSEIANLKKNGYNIFATYLNKNSRPVDKVNFNDKTAVLFGNEGSGLDEAVINLCDEKIIIPINQNSESLNVSVAAGILMWEIRKIIKNKNLTNLM